MDLKKLRNIGIIAHIDAGKTTLTERILFYTGKEHRMGTVDEGTAKMDYLAEEQERGITIMSAATTCTWRDYQINIIDTPGHVDFTAEVERSLRVLDGAVGVFCGVAGVEAQSETVWKQADRYKVPRIAFINKIDRVGADFVGALKSMKKRLHVKPVPIQYPVGCEANFQGIADLVRGEFIVFVDEAGVEVERRPIPDNIREEFDLARSEMIEAIAEHDDAIAERYLADEPVEADELIRALRAAVIEFKYVPVLCGAALRNRGVQPVLDAIVELLPSPLDVPPLMGVDPRKGNPVVRKAREDEPAAALIFKTVHDSHGELAYLRVYSGVVKKGDQLYNPNREKVERITRLVRIHADEREMVNEVGPGDIVAVVGLRFSTTGDTLCPKNHPILVEKMVFPETVVSRSIEPRTLGQRDELESALKALAKDDPTFRWAINEETGQMLISGMGELHLEILANRLLRDFKIDARVGQPRVAYKQTVGGNGTGVGTFDRLVAGKSHFSRVTISVSKSDSIQAKVTVDIPEGTLARDGMAQLTAAANSVTFSGLELGFPIINVALKVTGVETREGETTDVAISAATEMAFRDAMNRGGVVLVEPLMKFEVQSPSEFLGGIISDLNSRRARIEDIDSNVEPSVIRGTVPLAETFGYTTQLRSLSQGRASASMEPTEYQPVPEAMAKALFE